MAQAKHMKANVAGHSSDLSMDLTTHHRVGMFLGIV